MRAKAMGVLVGAGITLGLAGATWTNPTALAQRSRGPDDAAVASGAIIALPIHTGEGPPIVVLIDPQQRSLASYQIDGKSAQITLRCVRNFRWDLALDDYFGTEPSPEKIKNMLQPR